MKHENSAIVAVLNDGDNTTWASDAFLINLTPKETQALRHGDSKLLQGKSGPSLLECVALLTALHEACQMRYRLEISNTEIADVACEISERFEKMLKDD